MIACCRHRYQYYKISVHIIGIGGSLHLKSCWVHTQVTKECFVVVWLLGTNCGLIIRTNYKQVRIHEVNKSVRFARQIFSRFTVPKVIKIG